MQPDRWDNLTKLVGGTTSRRQALKTFAAGLLAALGGEQLWGRRANTAEAAGGKECENQPNTFCGTCAEFEAYVNATGATDADGHSHPKYAGATSYKIAYDPGKYKTVKTQRNQLWYCCGPVFDDYNTCVDECPALRCITKCFPLTGQVCVKTEGLNVQFGAQVEAVIMRWQAAQSERALSDACMTDYQRYVKQISDHENRHVEDIKKIVKKYNDAWQGKQYGECDTTEAKARQKLETRLKLLIESEVGKIGDEINQASNTFHNESGGRPVNPPQCDVCP